MGNSSLRRSKYGVRVDAAGKAARTVDGHTFASLAECKRYGELKLLEKAGTIRYLILQPSYGLYVRPFLRDGVAFGELLKCGSYIGDFQYDEFREGRWRRVVEDVKGVATAVYRLKRKFVEAMYGIEIREVRRR